MTSIMEIDPRDWMGESCITCTHWLDIKGNRCEIYATHPKEFKLIEMKCDKYRTDPNFMEFVKRQKLRGVKQASLDLWGE